MSLTTAVVSERGLPSTSLMMKWSALASAVAWSVARGSSMLVALALAIIE